LPLKFRIAAHGVSKLWRHLAPLADIISPRRGLLDLYFKIIESPVFERTRPWLLKNLRPFDREAYIAVLLEQHNYLPDDFRIWILEWPAKAVIACCWPGLPAKYYGSLETDDVELIEGCTFLGRVPPVVHTVLFARGHSEEPVSVDVPALLTWEDADGKRWLVLSENYICSYVVYTTESDALFNVEDEDGEPQD
ncbi:hypothetical protein FB451DRAFT_1008621, partial [Mycena latifolia]